MILGLVFFLGIIAGGLCVSSKEDDDSIEEDFLPY